MTFLKTILAYTTIASFRICVI